MLLAKNGNLWVKWVNDKFLKVDSLCFTKKSGFYMDH